MAQSLEDFQLFSELPPEIQRLIFEEAFEESGRKAVQLALVSREVRSWIEPLMYQCIILNHHRTYNGSTRLDLLSNTFYRGAKPKSFYANVVQRIFIDDLLHDLVETFLPLCSNVTHLAFWERAGPPNQNTLGIILSPDTFPKLRRLSVNPSSLPQSHLTYHHPIFKHLTHLDIVYRPYLPWDGFLYLESLTHLDLNFARDHFNAISFQSALQIAFPNFPSNLRCVVILVSAHIIWNLAYHSNLRDNETCQILDDVIKGKHHPGEVLGSLGGIRDDIRSRLKEDFARYIVPVDFGFSAQMYLPRDRKDFWMEADEIVEKRSRDQASRSNGRTESQPSVREGRIEYAGLE